LGSRCSYLEGQSVSGDLEWYLSQVLKHAWAEMSKNHALALKAVAVPDQRREIEKRRIRRIERPYATDEKITPVSQFFQRITPSGVAGVADRRPTDGYSQAAWGCGWIVGDGNSRGCTISEVDCYSRHEWNELCQMHARRCPAEDVECFLHPLGGGGRPGDREWACSTAKRCIEEQQCQSAEMVPVQVRDQDGINRRWINSGAPEGDECGQPAVNQYSGVTRLDENARLVQSALPKWRASSEKA